MEFVIYLTLIFIVLCFIEYTFYHSRDGKLFGKVPGPYKLPLIGNLHRLVLTGPEQMYFMMKGFANTYKDIFGIQVCSYKLVFIYNPEDIEIILSSSKHITKGIVYRFTHPWLQQGLVTSTGERWHERRRILTPAFHFNILRQFSKTFDEQSQHLIKNISMLGSQPISMFPVVTRCTMDVICETAMGTQVKTDENSFSKYKSAIHKIGDLIFERAMKIWLHPDILFKMSSVYRKQEDMLSILHSFTTSVIRNRRKERESGNGVQIIHNRETESDVYMSSGKKRLAMLDLLLSAEAEGRIDELGIREEVDTFMFGGHDTTASAICFCLMLLANHRDVQDKLIRELDEIFEDPDRAATMEDLNNLKYLEMCIKETLRMYPSVPAISRQVYEDVQLTNYLLPSDTMCFICIDYLHRDPTIYPSPDDFIPERFTPENCAKRHPFAYIPFSAGPRNCIGQKFAMLELKSVISRILRNFTLEPVTKPQDIVFLTDLVLRIKDSIYVKFVSRNQGHQQDQNGNSKTMS